LLTLYKRRSVPRRSNAPVSDGPGRCTVNVLFVSSDIYWEVMNIAFPLMFSVAMNALLGASMAMGQALPSPDEAALWELQHPAAERLHSVAGESRFVPLPVERTPMESILSSETTPTLDFPIRFVVDTRSGAQGYRVIVPPATPSGEYVARITGRAPNGVIESASITGNSRTTIRRAGGTRGTSSGDLA